MTLSSRSIIYRQGNDFGTSWQSIEAQTRRENLRYLIFILLASALSGPRAMACTAMYLYKPNSEVIQGVLDAADTVFLGTVESIETDVVDADTTIAVSTILVGRSWKGELSNRVVTKVTHRFADCSFKFREDKSYLIVANASDDGLYSVAFSSLSRAASDAAEIIEILDRLAREG